MKAASPAEPQGPEIRPPGALGRPEGPKGGWANTAGTALIREPRPEDPRQVAPDPQDVLSSMQSFETHSMAPPLHPEAATSSSATAADPRSPSAWRRIGPYDVVEEIGSGGMALVYKAIQPSLGRPVAIKVLRPEYVHDRQISTRFEREASALATLQHGNIVHVYDFAREANRAYIVMEYVEGVDLYDVLAEARRMPADVAALVARGVSEGLEHAHSRGIIHRDIKPSNIILSKKGEIKIMDFGIARDPGKSDLTRAGLAVGTPAYMAPEQIRGDTIDFRTDLFAVGIVLYEMLAGTKPWIEEEGRSITIKVLDEPMQPLSAVAPEIPPALVSIVERCLRKRPDQRFGSTHQLTSALDAYIQRHVAAEPRTRLLVYMHNRQLITGDEAATSVSTDLLTEASVRRRDVGIPLPAARLLLQPVLWAHAAAFALIVGICGLAGAGVWSDGEPRSAPIVTVGSASLGGGPQGSADAIGARASVGPAATEGPHGWVRIVVQPWARVFIDGQYFDTTPFDRPIALPPGSHRIGFRNPYFEDEDRFVEIREGETARVRVALKPTEESGEEDAP